MKNLLIITTLLFFSCNQNSNKEERSETDSISTSTDTTATTSYNYARHDDINIFMNDLATAISNNDKAAVAQMTEFPFTDHWPEFFYGTVKEKKELEDLSALNATIFFNKFDKIFIPELQNEIKNKKFRGFEMREKDPDIIKEGEYLILAEAPVNKRQYGLAIRKTTGVYKIYRTAFSL